MRRFHGGRYLPLLLLAVLAACHGDPVSVDNQFAGCYDHSCVSEPVRVPGVPALASVSARTSHTCGLTPAGEAWCWGSNTAGQLGDGTDLPRAAPVKVAGGIRFTAISVGAEFTCGISTAQTAYCWGSATGGQLGQAGPELCGRAQVRCARSPLALPGRSYVAVAAGVRHACALDTAGAAFCWGFNVLGETGSGAFGETVPTPFPVPGGVALASLAAGDAFTCGLTAAGRAYCWGSDNRGELGHAVGECGAVFGFASVCSPTPGPVDTPERFTALSLSNSHACGLTAAGTVLCWGDNGQGQLGTGTFENRVVPAVAQNGATFTAVNASGAATCATPTAGPSECWGLNLAGKLGTGTRVELSATPLPIKGGRRFVSFAGGADYVCALEADGAAYCWGSGRQGQLGTGELLP